MNVNEFRVLTEALSSVQWKNKFPLNDWKTASVLKKGTAIDFKDEKIRGISPGLCIITGINEYWSATKKGNKKDYHWIEYVLVSSKNPGKQFYLEVEYDDEIILTLSEKIPKEIKIRITEASKSSLSHEGHIYGLDEKEWVIMRNEQGEQSHFMVKDYILYGDEKQGISLEYWDDEKEYMFTFLVNGNKIVVYG